MWYDYFKLIIITKKNYIFKFIHKSINIDVNYITINANDQIKIFINVIVIRIEIIDIFWFSIVVVIVVVIIVTIIDELYIEKLSIVIAILLLHSLNNKLSDEFNEFFSLNIEKILTLIIEFELTSNIKLKEVKIKIKLFLILILCVEKIIVWKLKKSIWLNWNSNFDITIFFRRIFSITSKIDAIEFVSKSDDDLKKNWNVWNVWNV